MDSLERDFPLNEIEFEVPANGEISWSVPGSFLIVCPKTDINQGHVLAENPRLVSALPSEAADSPPNPVQVLR